MRRRRWPLGAYMTASEEGQGTFRVRGELLRLVLPHKVFKDLSGNLHHVLLGRYGERGFVGLREDVALDDHRTAVGHNDSGAEALTACLRGVMRDDFHLSK